MTLEHRFPQFRRWFLLIPFGLSAAMVIIGVLFRHTGSREDAPLVPIITMEALFLAQIILAAIFFYIGRGNRWTILFVTLVSFLFALFCEAMAGMSPTNVSV